MITFIIYCCIKRKYYNSNNMSLIIQDITALSRLPNLTSLGFKDPLYVPNPMCQLCNYTTQVLYHLPELQRLDGHDITNKTYKALAEVILMFYLGGIQPEYF